LRPNPGQRTLIPLMAIAICALMAAAGCAVAAAWQHSHHPAALPRPSCGSAHTHFLTARTQILAADHGALTCFVRAARECRSASLGITEMGVDTGTDYVFSIEPGTTPCQVTQDSRSYSANFGGSQGAVITVRCHRTAVTRAGVMLSCRGRDVLIPARVSVPSPHSG